MNTCGRQTNQNITRFNIFAGNSFALLNNANTETSKIVFVFSIETSHSSSFTADKGAA